MRLVAGFLFEHVDAIDLDYRVDEQHMHECCGESICTGGCVAIRVVYVQAL